MHQKKKVTKQENSSTNRHCIKNRHLSLTLSQLEHFSSGIYLLLSQLYLLEEFSESISKLILRRTRRFLKFYCLRVYLLRALETFWYLLETFSFNLSFLHFMFGCFFFPLHMHAVPTGARREEQIPWKWTYTMWVLVMKPRPSRRGTRTLNCWTISPAPVTTFYFEYFKEFSLYIHVYT